MTVLTFGELTWERARDLDRARTVAILPVGAVEAHGPHLPLTTDVIIAEAMARAGGARLAARGLDVVILPTLCYTVAEFAAGFPGTVSIGAETAAGLIGDVARSLAGQGFGVLALANAHLDPAHLDALERAARASATDTLAVVFPNLTRKPWALRLSDEFRSGACHAGRFETSIVLAERPELVDAGRAELEPNPRSLSDAIRAGKRTFEEAGGPRAYFGDPAEATAVEGIATVRALGEILDDAVAAVLPATRS